MNSESCTELKVELTLTSLLKSRSPSECKHKTLGSDKTTLWYGQIRRRGPYSCATKIPRSSRGRHPQRLQTKSAGTSRPTRDSGVQGVDRSDKFSATHTIRGQNEATTLEEKDLSWLSPIAIDLVQSLHNQGETVAHFLCQEKPYHSKKVSPQSAILHLVYQLLQKHPTVLTPTADFDVLCSLMQDHHQPLQDIDLSTTTSVMLQALQMLRGAVPGPIYILINRMD